MILILGANGMLGSMLLFYFKSYHSDLDILGLTKSEFNALNDDITKLDTYIQSTPIIINCIGAIPQKNYNNEEYIMLNTQFPKLLSTYCKNNNIKLIHISTNCVFSGKNKNYVETDMPDAQDDYGYSKYLGEPSYGLIIRCSVIGPEKHTFCGLMEWFLHTQTNEVNGFTDSFWNGLTTLELTKIILDIIKKDLFDNKVLHYYSEDTASKYEILEHINKLFCMNKILNKKENGLKYYTLSSLYTKPRKNIYQQLNELKDVYNDYLTFYKLQLFSFKTPCVLGVLNEKGVK